MRPRFVPPALGLRSENAAHRVAVEWDGGHEGVFIPRRDSDSRLNSLVGGRLFPGRHHPARFEIRDAGGRVEVSMASRDASVRLHVRGAVAGALPETSVFASLDEASAYFERGSLGYSATDDAGRYDGLVLDTTTWQVAPLAVESVSSSWFEDERLFPPGSVAFDHALIMRNVEHRWLAAPDLHSLGLARSAESCG